MKKLLLIFDLNKTLGFMTKSRGTSIHRFLNGKKHEKTGEYNIYFRNGRNEFLDFLFQKVFII